MISLPFSLHPLAKEAYARLINQQSKQKYLIPRNFVVAFVSYTQNTSNANSASECVMKSLEFQMKIAAAIVVIAIAAAVEFELNWAKYDAQS